MSIGGDYDFIIIGNGAGGGTLAMITLLARSLSAQSETLLKVDRSGLASQPEHQLPDHWPAGER
jgi:choline dehydrogenase-like flavoprotein